MGLLSDPEYGSVKWVRILKKIHGPLCFLCYIGAIVWFVMLGHRDVNNETYFSENALLPGLVTNEFNGEPAAKQFYNEFLKELEDKYSDSDAIPIPWLLAKMSQLNLEVYTHNFTLNYPLGQGQVFTGTNIYGILRAPRTSSLEAIVVSAPFRPLSSHQKGTAAGIALMLAFAQFARPQKYWAKDIIFLITEHEQLGMQAWLEAYHGIKSDKETFYTSLGSFWKSGPSMLDVNRLTAKLDWNEEHEKSLNPGTLRGRSGSIQAAINLEFDTPKIKYIEVKIEGLNGQLPNLDLVNLVQKLCAKSDIHHSFKSSYFWMKTRDKTEEWKNGVRTMLEMALTQIPGVPNGNHGLFHRFGIEAVTLEGRSDKDPAGVAPRVHSLSTANFHRLGTALESILRSLNNLLERFHQSYFFYLLAGTNRFVSIGQYMPSLCLLCLAMLIRALSLWVTIQPDEDTEKNTDKIKRKFKKNKKKEPKKDKLSDTEEENVETEKESDVEVDRTVQKKNEKKIEDSNISVFNISANYLVMHLIGYAVMNSPYFFTKIGVTYFDAHSEVSVFFGLRVTSIILTMIVPFFHKMRRNRITYEEITLVNILCLIELSTVCLSVGMHNFPLGLVIALVLAPVGLLAGGIRRGENRTVVLYLKRLLCLLLHPLAVLIICMTMYSKMLFPEENVQEVASRANDAAMQAIMFSIVDSIIYGNWLFNVVTSVIVPIWLIFWQIHCTTVD